MKPPESNEERWDVLEAEFFEIFKTSRLPQSLEHARGTLNWVKKFNSNVDLAMEIAAIGHDLDRCKDEWKVEKEDHPNERSFRVAHAQKSAELVCDFLREHGFDSELIARVQYLITHHEYGVDEETINLMRADCFSFFEYNFPLYCKQKGEASTRNKIRLMFEKLLSEDQEEIRAMVVNYDRDLADYNELTDQDWGNVYRLLEECIN